MQLYRGLFTASDINPCTRSSSFKEEINRDLSYEKKKPESCK